jgi:hypothetical protein
MSVSQIAKSDSDIANSVFEIANSNSDITKSAIEIAKSNSDFAIWKAGTPSFSSKTGCF